MTLEEENNIFCNNVKKLCEKNGMSLFNLKDVGLNKTDIKQIIMGNIDEMPIIDMLLICDYFSVSLQDLFDTLLFNEKYFIKLKN
jgi:hypothetical protein